MRTAKTPKRTRIINRFQKYLVVSITPQLWPALLRGVMPTVEHRQALNALNPKTLIDVGANKGQFSTMARHLFPSIDIHAFEPLAREREIYVSVVQQPFSMHSKAIGATNSNANFFVTSRSDSSSLLQPRAEQHAAYGVSTDHIIEVPVQRLADALDVGTLKRPVLLKIDVQGAELDVLKGAADSLEGIDFIYCEASFVELYENQPLASDIVTYLFAHSFTLRGVFNESFTRAFGATQADLLFVRFKA